MAPAEKKCSKGALAPAAETHSNEDTDASAVASDVPEGGGGGGACTHNKADNTPAQASCGVKRSISTIVFEAEAPAAEVDIDGAEWPDYDFLELESQSFKRGRMSARPALPCQSPCKMDLSRRPTITDWSLQGAVEDLTTMAPVASPRPKSEPAAVTPQKQQAAPFYAQSIPPTPALPAPAAVGELKTCGCCKQEFALSEFPSTGALCSTCDNSKESLQRLLRKKWGTLYKAKERNPKRSRK